MSNAKTLQVINAGSSSIKFSLYELDAQAQGGLRPSLHGQISGIGTERPTMSASDADRRVLADQRLAPAEADSAVKAQRLVSDWLSAHASGVPVAVGHRVVHGGTAFTGPVLIDDAVLQQLDAYTSLAPLHQPHNLAPIRAIRAQHPELPQVACFDTAFHRAHSDLADRFAVPEPLYERGVRRYGFHGLSYEYIAQRLKTLMPALAAGKVIVAHLGSGASACAMQAGRSVDSTMGFTALDGLPMGTRPGRLDAGVVLWMMEQGMNHDAIESMLYHGCGLKGLSGISNDMRDLQSSSDPRAKRALDYFAWRAAEAIAGMGCALGGIDGIVFTAGIGEHSAPTRAGIAAHWQWLGVKIDAERNERHDTRISTDDSRIGVYVVPTDEEWIIARHTLGVIGA
jgi:acetate kinase